MKRLHVTADEAAHRELAIAQELQTRQLRQVMSILDAGQDADSNRYFVVMPIAEGGSLQDAVDTHGKLTEKEAVESLIAIATGLGEIPSIVHRDLKPANVLKHENVWKVADFGIARFVEESTSANTLKDCLSPPYAAPEQWRMETCSAATDVYSMGCVAHTVINGGPPFAAGSIDDWKVAHLTKVPRDLDTQNTRLRALVASMLRKRPEARPSLARVLSVLQTTLNEPVPIFSGRAALQDANAHEAPMRIRAETQDFLPWFGTEESEVQILSPNQNIRREARGIGLFAVRMTTSTSARSSDRRDLQARSSCGFWRTRLRSCSPQQSSKRRSGRSDTREFASTSIQAWIRNSGLKI